MGLVVKYAVHAEPYVPDVGTNRTDPQPVVVALSSPDAGLWRRYQSRIVAKRMALAEAQSTTDHAVAFTDVRLEPLDPDMEGVLFGACVGQITGLTLEDGTPITSGEQLWALRARLDRGTVADLIADCLSAIYDRATLDEGLAQALASRPGSSGSPTSAPETVEPVGAGAST